MNREIKFRAWDAAAKKMYSPEFPWIGAGSSAANIAICLDGIIITPNAYSLDYGSIPNVPELQIMQLAGVIGGIEIWEDHFYSAKFRTKEGVTEVTGTIVMDDFMWCLVSVEQTYSINRLYDFQLLGNVFETIK